MNQTDRSITYAVAVSALVASLTFTAGNLLRWLTPEESRQWVACAMEHLATVCGAITIVGTMVVFKLVLTLYGGRVPWAMLTAWLFTMAPCGPPRVIGQTVTLLGGTGGSMLSAMLVMVWLAHLCATVWGVWYYVGHWRRVLRLTRGSAEL